MVDRGSFVFQSSLTKGLSLSQSSSMPSRIDSIRSADMVAGTTITGVKHECAVFPLFDEGSHLWK